MSLPVQLIDRANQLGLRLERRGDKVAIIPRNRVPTDFADVLREHKTELLEWLTRPPCPGWQSIPADDLPLTLEMPRPTPHHRQRMIAYMLRQGCDRPGELTAWLVRRECAYYDGPGRRWDCALHAYAAARDAACWQLKRSERDVLHLLASFEEFGA